jgi:hypothetical protein
VQMYVARSQDKASKSPICALHGTVSCCAFWGIMCCLRNDQLGG